MPSLPRLADDLRYTHVVVTGCFCHALKKFDGLWHDELSGVVACVTVVCDEKGAGDADGGAIVFSCEAKWEVSLAYQNLRSMQFGCRGASLILLLSLRNPHLLPMHAPIPIPL